MKSPAQRFWEKVDRLSNADCWEWKAGLFKSGYGAFSYKGHPQCSHRVAWELTYGDIPHGMFVCHTCDNRKCCNPAHLWLGTHTDNMRDKVNKNRQSRLRGELGGLSKLTWVKVNEIRQLYMTGRYTQRTLASVFNVGKTTIAKIVRGETWK